MCSGPKCVSDVLKCLAKQVTQGARLDGSRGVVAEGEIVDHALAELVMPWRYTTP